jgi:hypothetical protein
MFAMSLIMAATACAENNCPWMNEATASDLVGGGDAVGAFAAAQGKSAVCTFTEHDRKAMRTLQISVELAGDPHASFLSTVQQGCRSTSAPLKAIGNEAVTCTIDRHKAGMGERALGRVRDQVFVVTISTTLKDDPILTSAVLKMKIGTAAEQVAGNLF